MSTPTPPASPAEATRPPDHGTPGSELRQLRAQLSLCRDVLEECRPMVKARLCEMADHTFKDVDDSILTRIEEAQTRIEQALKAGL